MKNQGVGAERVHGATDAPPVPLPATASIVIAVKGDYGQRFIPTATIDALVAEIEAHMKGYGFSNIAMDVVMRAAGATHGVVTSKTLTGVLA